MKFTGEVVDELHLGNINQTELEYQLVWAQTYLKNYRIIVNNSWSDWSMVLDYTAKVELNEKKIVLYSINKIAQHRLNNG